MALSAYELLVIVRAQNQASGVLRSVGRDLRAMGASGVSGSRGLKAINNQRWDNVSRGGTIMRDTGRAARLFGLVTAAGFGYAAKAAADFETEVTLAATQTGRASKNMFVNVQDIGRNTQTISKGILEQMHQFPATSHEMAQAAYEIFSSLDTSVGGGVKLLKVFNKAAVAGQTDLMAVTKSGITVLNDFDANSRDLAQSMTTRFQRMFAAVRFGRMTFEEFAQSLNTTVPAAKAADQSFDTLSGTMAFLTRRMPNVRMAGTSLARLMELLGRKKMVDNLKAAGVQITDTRGRMLQLPVIMDKLIKKFPELATGGERLRNFFKEFSGTEGTIMARRAFVFLAKDMALYRQMLHFVITDNAEFDRSFATLSQTGGVKWKTFLNGLRADVIEFGKAALPAIMALAEPIQRLMHWFEKLDDSTKKTIGKWGVYAAAIMLVGGSIASIGGGILNLVGILGRFGLLGAGFIGFFVRLGTVLLIAQAVLGSTGHSVDLLGRAFEGLKHILSGFFNFATSGLGNFGIALGGIGLLVGRMASTRTRMLQQAGKEATAGGILSTMLWGVGGRPGFKRQVQAAERELATVARARRVREPFSLGRVLEGPVVRDAEKAARSSSRMSGALRSAGTALAVMPGSLKLVAGAIGLGAVAFGLWKLHTRGAREEAERIKGLFETIRAMGGPAAQFGNFGLDERNLGRARLNVHMIQGEIKTLRAEIAKAGPGTKPMLIDQLKGLKFDLQDAMDVVDVAGDKMRTSFQAVGNFINRYSAATAAVKSQQGVINKLQGEYNRLLLDRGKFADTRGEGGFETRLRNLGQQIQTQKKNLKSFTDTADEQLQLFKRSFDNVLRTMRFELPPIKFKGIKLEDFKKDILGAITRLGGVTPGQLKLLVRAELDPKIAATLPAKLKAALAGAQKQTITIRAKIVAQQKLEKKQTGQVQDALKLIPKIAALPIQGVISQAKEARTKAQAQLKPIFQRVKIIPPNGVAVGAQIMRDIDAGMGDHTVNATVLTRHVDTYFKVMAKAAEAKSPSRRAAREIGKPIGQGIAVGLLETGGFLQKTALVTIDDMFAKMRQQTDVGITLFAGTYLQKLEEAIKPLTKIQEGRLADLEAKLAAGKKMSHSQLASMHQLQQRQTGKLRPIDLTRDTQRQLTQLRLFNSAIEQLTNRGAPVALLNQLRDLGVEGTKYITQLANMSEPALKRFIGTFRQLQAETEKTNTLSLADYTQGLKASNDEIFKWEQGIKRLKAAHVDSRVIDYFINKGLAGYAELAALLEKKNTPAFRKYVNEILRGNRLINASNIQTAQAIAQANQEAWTQARNIAHDKLIEIRNMYVGFMGQLFSNISALPSLMSSFTNPFAGLDTFMQTQQAALSASNDAVSSAQDGQDQALQRQKQIDDAWKAEHDRLQGVFGELFSGPIAQDLQGFTLSMQDLKDDLRAQLDAFRDWRGALDDLAGRGVPQAMLDSLEALGPAATENIRTLADASATDLKDYIGMWKESQSAIDDSIDKDKLMADAMDNMSSSIGSVATSIGELIPTMQDLLAAQAANTAGLVQWANDLKTLAERHIPRELLREIMEQGPEAAAAVHLLATASDADLQAFAGSWQTAHDTIAGINADIIAMTDPAAILKGLEEQNTAFSNWQNDLATTRDRLLDNGITSADADTIIQGLQDLGPDAAGFVHAISTMSDPELQAFVTLWQQRQGEITTATQKEFTKQLEMWRQHGRNIAIAIVNGIADERGILEAWFRNMFNNLMASGSVPSAGSVASRAASTAFGGFFAEGGTGIVKKPTLFLAGEAGPERYNFTPLGKGGGGKQGTTVHMTVNAVADESLDTTLARASFRLKNQALS